MELSGVGAQELHLRLAFAGVVALLASPAAWPGGNAGRPRSECEPRVAERSEQGRVRYAVTLRSPAVTPLQKLQMHVQMVLQPHGPAGRMSRTDSDSSEGGVSIGHRDYSSTSPTVSVTAADDLRTHEVREIDVVPAARGGRSRYPPLGGQMITAASMAAPARRRCPRCTELCDDEETPRATGLLRRLGGRQ